jgi:hypothetical protein
MFPKAAVTLSGDLREYRYASDNGSSVTKAFCATCGSPIFGTNTRMPDHMTLTLGTMDDARELAVEVVIFARDKPHWDTFRPDVATFATQPDWTPPD